MQTGRPVQHAAFVEYHKTRSAQCMLPVTFAGAPVPLQGGKPALLRVAQRTRASRPHAQLRKSNHSVPCMVPPSIAVVAIALLAAFAVEAVQWALVYRTENFQQLKRKITLAEQRLEARAPRLFESRPAVAPLPVAGDAPLPAGLPEAMPGVFETIRLCVQAVRSGKGSSEKARKKKEGRHESEKRSYVQAAGKARFTTNIVVRFCRS